MDTLVVSERLISVGVPEPVAKAHAQVLSKVADDLKDEMATRSDNLKDELATKADLQLIAANIQRTIAESEARTAWRNIGAMTALTAIFSVILVVVQIWSGG